MRAKDGIAYSNVREREGQRQEREGEVERVGNRSEKQRSCAGYNRETEGEITRIRLPPSDTCYELKVVRL